MTATIEQVLERITPYVYVVGSTARGTANENSDLDLYIRYTHDGEISLDAIRDELDDLQVPYNVDIDRLGIFITCFSINLDMSHYFGVDEVSAVPVLHNVSVYGVDMTATIDQFVSM